MLYLPNYAEDVSKVKTTSDLADSLTSFSTDYLFMMVFHSNIEGLEEWGY